NEIIFEALEAGAIGILPKNAEKEELLNAIDKVSKHEEYLGDFIKNIIVKSYINKTELGRKYIAQKDIILSEREIEVIKLSAEGFSSKEIGSKLFISARTVESHKNNIMQKLNYTSTIELVKYAIKNKIIEI
ncbi:MAG: response regulator transcription factor, partial [Bacteroidales bacterium]|nr:response regulator transcription factor [Bacteroidales bacterium]